MADHPEMRSPRRVNAILAIIASLIALVITVPFSAAFHQAYGAGDTPTWLSPLARSIPELLNFSTGETVYQTYGRIYSLVIPLSLPALFLLKRFASGVGRMPLLSWRIFGIGALLAGIGIVGDYWPPPTSILIGVGFSLELLGTLVMWVGSILWGATAVRQHGSRWFGFALLSIVPVGVVAFAILGHIPSGPWFGYFLFLLVMGFRLLGGYGPPAPTATP